MDKNLWCGTCSVEFPELVTKVHEDYIKAGADVITTNTYACTPISMKNYGLEDSIQEFNQKSVRLAKEAIKNSKNSSMWNSISAQIDGDADISLSAGNTGVLFVISKMILKMMKQMYVLAPVVKLNKMEKSYQLVVYMKLNFFKSFLQV